MTKEAIDDGYRAVAYSVGEELEKALARIRELEKELAEARAQVAELKGNWKKYEPIVGRMEKAEAEAARLRAALEVYANEDNWLRSIGPLAAQVALSPAPQPSADASTWTIADGWPAGEDAKRFVDDEARQPESAVDAAGGDECT